MRGSLLAVLFTMFVGFCLYLVYSVVDQGVSLDYARSEQQSLKAQLSTLRAISLDLAQGTERGRVKSILAERYLDHIVKEEGDVISVDGIELHFRAELLADIVAMNSGTSAP